MSLQVPVDWQTTLALAHTLTEQALLILFLELVLPQGRRLTLVVSLIGVAPRIDSELGLALRVKVKIIRVLALDQVLRVLVEVLD